MGQDRVEQLKRDFDVEIDYRAFFLRPDLPPEGMPRPEKYNNPNSPVQRAAEEAGILMNRPAIVPYTRLALEATEAAKSLGQGEKFHELAYASYWENGTDLGKIDNLKPIVEAAELDWETIKDHLVKRTFKLDVEKQYEEALKVGVTGIPAYVIGSYFFMGAQPYEVFKQVAEKAIAHMEENQE